MYVSDGENKPIFSEIINSLRLNRIKNEIIQAAKAGEIYHLWWHPHNFGIDPEGAIKTLKSTGKTNLLCLLFSRFPSLVS